MEVQFDCCYKALRAITMSPGRDDILQFYHCHHHLCSCYPLVCTGLLLKNIPVNPDSFISDS